MAAAIWLGDDHPSQGYCVVQTIELETGYTLADANQGRACDAQWQINERVFDTPATTTEGIRFKLEVLKSLKGCHVPTFKASLKRDLLRMAGIYDA